MCTVSKVKSLMNYMVGHKKPDLFERW